MAQSGLRPPAYLQPRIKANSTFSNSSVTATAIGTPPRRSSPSSQSRPSSPTRSFPGVDASTKSTAALIRRILCPHAHGSSAEPHHIDELLPPLTSSNNIDLQLYAIIAIVVKELVYSWYGKITPDQAFVEEVVRIIAHCTRALEGRLRSMDLEGLVFDEIPELVENHVIAYRISHQQIPSSPSTDPHVIYHNLNPHPALSPVPNPAEETTIQDQSNSETVYRQLLVHGALAVLLPTEELENACVRTLIADVIGETILGNSIGAKASEGWFIWGSVIKIVDVVKAHLEPKATGEDIEADSRSRLERLGLLSERGQSTEARRHSRRSILSKVCWRILQYGYLIFLGIRFVVLGLVAASSRTPRSPSRPGIVHGADSPPIAKMIQAPEFRRPIVKFRIFSLISVLFNLSLSMPWLSGLFSLLQHHMIHGPLKLGATNGLLDQYIHHLILTHLSPLTLLPPLLLSLRHTLFPNASLPPPATPSPTPTQQLQIKKSCARALASLVPLPVLKRFFRTADPLAEIERELDVWGDGYLNRHLAYAVLERVVVRVLPELGERGVSALMEARLGEGEASGAGEGDDEREIK